ncbi:hypothetical protein [Streptomyces collinus]|uniref:hypothetical protein n=1 Tax=Streptomyces collinus TaxID=42684 RepID=UPI00362AFD46
MPDADSFHEVYEDDDLPPRVPVRPARRSDDGSQDHYGVVRPDPTADDPQHDETSPQFVLGAPTPGAPAPGAPAPGAATSAQQPARRPGDSAG